MCPQSRQRFERRGVGSKGAEPKIAREHAQVVLQALHALNQPHQVRLAHVQVQIAQMQERVAVEGIRKACEQNVVSPQLDAQRVASSAAVQAH